MFVGACNVVANSLWQIKANVETHQMPVWNGVLLGTEFSGMIAVPQVCTASPLSRHP
jgi:hypothetical protein